MDDDGDKLLELILEQSCLKDTPPSSKDPPPSSPSSSFFSSFFEDMEEITSSQPTMQGNPNIKEVENHAIDADLNMLVMENQTNFHTDHSDILQVDNHAIPTDLYNLELENYDMPSVSEVLAFLSDTPDPNPNISQNRPELFSMGPFKMSEGVPRPADALCSQTQTIPVMNFAPFQPPTNQRYVFNTSSQYNNAYNARRPSARYPSSSSRRCSQFTNHSLKVVNQSEEELKAIQSYLDGVVRPGPDVQIYKCHKCYVEFPNAQAYGGHMSSHSKKRKAERLS